MALKNYYETTDLGLATALAAVGIQLAEIDKSNPRRATFIFVENIETRQLVDDYWNDTLAISARLYFENMKRLKARLYA